MQPLKTLWIKIPATLITFFILSTFPGKAQIINEKFPDTISIGSYRLIVEEYYKGGKWNSETRTFQNLSGIGRVESRCGNRIRFPYDFKLPIFSQRKSSPDAATYPASNSLILLPHVISEAVIDQRYSDNEAPPIEDDAIPVEFTKLEVQAGRLGVQPLAIDGIAHYLPNKLTKKGPFFMDIYAGFTLQVNSLTIYAKGETEASARLFLPNSLTSANECLGASLDLGVIKFSANCEFYKVLADSTYGIFGVGNTTLGIQGKGYVVDFSSTTTYAPVGKPNSWKGVVLIKGTSKGSPIDSVVSNIGYLQAQYSFANALVETDGLTASLTNVQPYRFTSSQPFGYIIDFNNALVNLEKSQVKDGALSNGKIQLPRSSVRQANDATVVVEYNNIAIRPSMDLAGTALLTPDTGVYWGDLVAAGGKDRKSFGVENIDRTALIFFSARPRQLFLPISADGKSFNTPFNNLSPAVLDSFGIQGATFAYFSVLVVNTPDIPGTWKPNDPKMPWNSAPVRFQLNQSPSIRWLNVATEGVHCSISSFIYDSPGFELGDPSEALYVGINPFKTQTNIAGKKSDTTSILLQCVESAVIACDYRSSIILPQPTNSVTAFKEMVFTSTANNAGGKLTIGNNDSLSYWGLKLVPKPGFSSAGLVSVKTGQIVLTAAGLSEERHFSQPFWINWGEILANGAVGRLFFDFNSAGQQFDGFGFVHSAVALSPYDPTKESFLRVGGMVHLPFFGGDYLHIQDFYTPAVTATPFNSRRVKFSSASTGSFLPTDVDIAGNWSDGLGIFNFALSYNDATQDGFLGTGNSLLRNLIGGNIVSSLDMNRRGACIRIGSNLNDQRSISLGPVANISNITRIWGCACIKNDGIDNLVVGGEVANAANVSIAARAGSYLSAVLQVTPSLARITVDGQAYLSIAAALDAEVNGHMQLTMNFAQGFMEGEVAGKMRVAEGSVLVGSSLEAEGQVNWHFGSDFQELQGMVSLRVMGTGAGAGVGAGFYIGRNAPKSRAWVLIGTNPNYSLNMAALPNNLTGIYGSIHIEQGINLYIISGGYDFYLGLGAFILEPGGVSSLGGLPTGGVGTPYVIGNMGGRIHGEILGGLVSAGARFNMQIIAPYPFQFQGTVGLEGCVLWVFCGSVDITVGLNTTEGFYIR